ncbi:TPA: BspA family leucine-rich repeat surface protein [Listeria monocytogenes]|uniref:BspA family leucine-rich repeat surface protein n=1 Tax=Listeria monocytogenes TaxID=1639 RepID=A0A8H9JTP3_LISMN|nr:BspA family leucine-rich repeat surface protein [Listeria monocytogenes]HAO5923431.1 BspA family leucine-rich repeat surface protein [Listeria monocytogenes]
MKNHKKRLSQIVVALLIVYTIGLPIQNVVLASELPTNEIVVTESTTAEKNTSNSADIESKVLTDKPKVKSSEKQESSKEPSSTTQQNEERPSTKAVTSGAFPNGSTATWNFDDTTGTLTISGGTLVNPAKPIHELTGIPVSEITDIVLEDKVFASGNCSGLFYNSVATSLDLSNFDTSNVSYMSEMFSRSAVTSLDLSNFDTSNVSSMMNMFYGSAATSLDVSNFDTSNVISMRNMFSGSAATSIDVSNFNTSNVTTMYGMFSGSAVTSIDVSNFDTSNVTNMPYMFSRSAVTTLDVSSFNTSKVTNMTDMFSGTQQLQNITLGNQFQFLSANAGLPNPTPTADYTGKWQNVGNGTVNDPKGVFAGTATELMSTYDGSTMADTYVWQPTLLEVNVQDSVLMVGDTWNPADNFLSADNTGNPVEFKDIIVTGSVNTTQPGVYSVDYSYGSMTSTATITVLETIPASWVNFFVDGTNVRSIPGSALSTANWDLTTGLWDSWNPGTIKVPTAKLPSEPTKQGYEFKGWEDTTGSIVDFNTLDLDLNSQNEFNFYGAFEKKEYTVTFDIDGKKETQKVLFEDLIKEPVAPKKEGHKFVGWYTSPQTKATKWDFSTMGMPANDLTLHAKFTKLSDSGSGSESGGSEKPSKPVSPVTPPEQPENKESTSDSKDKISTSNSGSMTVTSQENISTSSEASQQSKLAQLGEQNSMILQGFGLLMVISGVAFFLWRFRKAHL